MSESLKIKEKERRSNGVRSRRRQEELSWGSGQDSCRERKNEGWSRTEGGASHLLRLEERNKKGIRCKKKMRK